MDKAVGQLIVDIVDVYYRAEVWAGQVNLEEVDELLWDLVNQMEEVVERLEGIMRSER